MAERLPYTKAQRRKWADTRFGYRPACRWGMGDLPAPFAEGDIVRVPDGARALERLNGMQPGPLVVCSAFSIDEGDAWFFRVTDGIESSDRLHIAYTDRVVSWPGNRPVNWLEGCELIDTADSAGLARRVLLLAHGWAPPVRDVCPTCRRER